MSNKNSKLKKNQRILKKCLSYKTVKMKNRNQSLPKIKIIFNKLVNYIYFSSQDKGIGIIN